MCTFCVTFCATFLIIFHALWAGIYLQAELLPFQQHCHQRPGMPARRGKPSDLPELLPLIGPAGRDRRAKKGTYILLMYSDSRSTVLLLHKFWWFSDLVPVRNGSPIHLTRPHNIWTVTQDCLSFRSHRGKRWALCHSSDGNPLVGMYVSRVPCEWCWGYNTHRQICLDVAPLYPTSTFCLRWNIWCCIRRSRYYCIVAAFLYMYTFVLYVTPINTFFCPSPYCLRVVLHIQSWSVLYRPRNYQDHWSGLCDCICVQEGLFALLHDAIFAKCVPVNCYIRWRCTIV